MKPLSERFRTIKASEAPSTKEGRGKYDELYEACSKLAIDEVILVDVEDQSEAGRIGAALYAFFGAGEYSVLKVSNDPLQYIIRKRKHVKR